MEYASKGMAGTALGLGIGSAVLSVANGGLGNLFGGWGANPAAVAAMAAGAACSENTGVNRYELDQQQTIANQSMEIAYWRGQDETNRKITDSYARMESRYNDLAAEVRANKAEQDAVNLQQAVYNGTNTAAVGCIQNQVSQLLSLTKLVVPNGSVSPGWGNATVTVSTGTTTT